MDMKKLIPSIFAVLGMLLTPFVPQIQDFITNHPTVALLVSGISVIIANFAPQPHKDA